MHDPTQLDPAEYLAEEVLIETVRRAFSFAGVQGGRALLVRPPAEAFILLANDSLDGDPRQQDTNGRFAKLNAIIVEEASAMAGVTIIDTRSFIAGPEEITDVLHFDRKVYFRIFQHITALLAEA